MYLSELPVYFTWAIKAFIDSLGVCLQTLAKWLYFWETLFSLRWAGCSGYIFGRILKVELVVCLAMSSSDARSLALAKMLVCNNSL